MKTLMAILMVAGLSSAAFAQEETAAKTLSASLVNDTGRNIGSIKLDETPNGLLVSLEVTGLSSGWHAAHIHGTGDCSDHAEHFKKAGSHLSREGEEHGFYNEKGPHAGDLPNFLVQTDGSANVQFFASGLTLAEIADADGSAFMIHEQPDDYKSDPAGNAGARLACGVLK